MLIRFNVKNFLSFDLEDRATHDTSSQEFSMIPGKVRSKEDHILKTGKQNLLKFAAIYGANAAGKSNLIKAMAFPTPRRQPVLQDRSEQQRQNQLF